MSQEKEKNINYTRESSEAVYVNTDKHAEVSNLKNKNILKRSLNSIRNQTNLLVFLNSMPLFQTKYSFK